MANPSRRNLIAGVLAAPLAAPPASTTSAKLLGHDPLAAKAAGWIDVDATPLRDDTRVARAREPIVANAYRVRMDRVAASRLGLLQARTFRSISRWIKAAHHNWLAPA